MNCKICGATDRDCDCEAIIQAHVVKILQRFGRLRKAVANLDSRDLMRKEGKSCTSGVDARSRAFTSQA